MLVDAGLVQPPQITTSRGAGQILASIRLITFGGALVIALASSAATSGPGAGSNFPDFKAKDQSGKNFTLHQTLGQEGGVVVACLAADVARVCGQQLREFEEARTAFELKGLKVAALSSASSATLQGIAEKSGIHFPLLTTQDKRLSAGVYVLDAKGVIKEKYSDDDDRVHFTAANILTRVAGIVPAQTKYASEGKQLRATPMSSNPDVLPGQRIALILDLELKPNMHVYAAGAKGYLPIEWTIKDNDIAKGHEIAYPQPEPFLMTATSESVPAYKNHIRLIRDVTISPTADFKSLNAIGEFVIEGTLKYQACDDRMCFFPQEMPLLWTLKKASK